MREDEYEFARLRVLIVDDDADMRLGLRRLVESLGAEVREAASGERACEMLGGWTPRVMVADVVIGADSGLELLRRVRERWPEIRVLVISGYRTPELEARAMRLGAAGFLAKPFDNAELLAEVERLGA